MAPTTLKYSPLVNVDLSANAINFADAETDGHRVTIDMSAVDLNAHFVWNRGASEDRPVGSVTDLSGFKTKLEAALTAFNDLDGIAGGLDFSAGALSDSTNETNTVNDLVLQYVLFKVYGASNYTTANVVYNVGDATGMTTNADVAEAIRSSISGNNTRGGHIDQMFRDLLAADPARFFDASGKQITGLFETSAGISGTGDWKLAANDKLEIKLSFTFQEPVTRRVVSSQQQPLSGDASGASEVVHEQEVIAANATMKIRLQIVVV